MAMFQIYSNGLPRSTNRATLWSKEGFRKQKYKTARMKIFEARPIWSCAICWPITIRRAALKRQVQLSRLIMSQHWSVMRSCCARYCVNRLRTKKRRTFPLSSVASGRWIKGALTHQNHIFFLLSETIENDAGTLPSKFETLKFSICELKKQFPNAEFEVPARSAPVQWVTFCGLLRLDFPSDLRRCHGDPNRGGGEG